MQQLANIGMIGLGVMGQNLALNIERNGYSVAVWDREPAVRARFLADTVGKRIIDSSSPEEFVRSLERPRKIILLVKAGDPVDWTINLIKPFLDNGDIIIDGGNSHFKDTERREQQLRGEGFFMIGSGTSGGEKGALLGPSLMPGGDRDAYEKIRADLGSNCSESSGWSLRDIHRAWRFRSLREDGSQRDRVRRHATHRRSLRFVTHRFQPWGGSSSRDF